jgi:hypothetical protein
MADEVKPDESVLFPEANIDGVVVKPWSFGKLFDLSVLLETVLDKAEAKGIIAELNQGSVISYTTMAKLFAVASPEVLKIISTTIDKSEEEVRALPMTTGVKVAIAIFSQNKETIKNALSPLISK